jgi:hypothetical protein
MNTTTPKKPRNARKIIVPDEPRHSRIREDYQQGYESGYANCWYEFIEAIQDAGCVPVTRDGMEIKQ